MKKYALAFALVALVAGWGYADFAGTGFSNPPFSIPNYWSGTGDYLKYDGTRGTPSGSGTVTGPATATENNMVTWGADNTTLKDSGVAVPNQALSTTSSPTFATQTANDNSSKVATTAYVDQRYQYVRASIPEPGVNDNTIIIGPLFRQWSIDNVTAVVMDNTGKLSGAATDNVTFNVQYATNSSFSSTTNVYTSDVTATGAANYSGALNNTSPPTNGYIRVSFSASNMTFMRFYIQIRYKEL